MDKHIYALSSFNVPVQTILVRKVGALYLKNLFYFLDRFKLPKNPHELDSGDGLSFEIPLPMVQPIDEVRFVFYRDPLDRLIAFYYDQILYESPRNLVEWRSPLKSRGFNFSIDCPPKQHQKNIDILLRYVEEKIKKDGILSLPDQLAPQYKFLLPAIDLGFEPINLIRANFELVTILDPYIEDAEKKLKKVEKLIMPITPYMVREIVTNSAVKLHRKLFEGDYELYWAYRDGAA